MKTRGSLPFTFPTYQQSLGIPKHVIVKPCLTLSDPCSRLSNLLSARSLLDAPKGSASKMLRATGHARMVMFASSLIFRVASERMRMGRGKVCAAYKLSLHNPAGPCATSGSRCAVRAPGRGACGMAGRDATQTLTVTQRA